MSIKEFFNINRTISRREFAGNLFFAVSLLLGLGALTRRAVQFVQPEIEKASLQKVLVASVEEVPAGASKAVELFGHKMVLLQGRKGYRAFSSVCTDLGCTVGWDAGRNQFVCPCHMGIYDADGNVVSGPPPRPLDQYEVEVKDGNIYVAVAVEGGSNV